MPVLLLIPPLLFAGGYYLLHATGPAAVLILMETPLVLGLVERYNHHLFSISVWGKWARLSLYALLFSTFLIFILLIPDTFYHAWLILLYAGKPGGVISFAFVYALGIVSSFGCSTLITGKRPGPAFLELLLMINMVLVILYPRKEAVIPFVFLTGFKFFILQAESGRSWKSVLSVILILFPALIISFLVPLIQDEPRGNPLINRLSGSLQKSIARVYPDLPLILNVPGYGTSFGSSRKTGEKPLLSPRVIFTVEGAPSTVLYLKTDVFYFMSGQWWIPGDINLPLTADDRPELRSFQKFRLTMKTDLYTRIPLSISTMYFEAGKTLYSTPEGTAYAPPGRMPLVRGDVLDLYSSSQKQSSHTITESEIRKSLQVPKELSEILRPLALRLKGEDETASLRNIRNYLTDNFSYTLETKPSDSMIENFLFESHSGYCVHFSTSAALLARTLNIPVRIAEGFICQIPEYDDNSYASPPDRSTAYVTGFSAHQWPEILSGGQWIPWEVTPPFTGLVENPSIQGFFHDRYTRNQLETLGLQNSQVGDDHSSGVKGHFPLGPFFSVLAFLFLVWLGFRIYNHCNRISDRNLRRRLKKIVMKGIKKNNLPSPEESGWMAWFSHYGNQFPESRQREPDVQNLVLRYLYAKESLGEADRHRLLKSLRKIEGTISTRRKMNHQ